MGSRCRRATRSAIGAQRPRRLHVVLAPETRRIGAHQATGAVPPGEGQQQDERHQRNAVPRREGEEEDEQPWNRQQRIDDAHERGIQPSRLAARHESHRRAEDDGKQRRGQPNEQGEPQATRHAREHIAAELIGAEQVTRARGQQRLVEQVTLRGRIRQQQWPEDRTDGEECEQDDSGPAAGATPDRGKRASLPWLTEYAPSDRARR